MTVSAELRDWLSTEHAGLDGSATSVREDDAIAERVATMVRPLRARRAAVGGAVVFHDTAAGRSPRCTTVAFSSGQRRAGDPRSRDRRGPRRLAVGRSVAPRHPFRRGTDVLRDLLADAFPH